MFVIGAAFTGILTQAAHPDISVWGGRLIVLVWLLPVVGVQRCCWRAWCGEGGRRGACAGAGARGAGSAGAVTGRPRRRGDQRSSPGSWKRRID
ncbi:hypothetical protein ACRAWF_00940 [Streptomyces sp. L7]